MRKFLCVLSVLCGSMIVRAQQPPRFQSSVEVTSFDVAVVDGNGRPMRNLVPADFIVRVDGEIRRVVSAEWISLVPDAKAAAAAPIVDGYSSNENMGGGRLFVIAIDEPNIHFGGATTISAATNQFIDKLSPADRVAVVGLGIGSATSAFSSDHERIKQAIARAVGRKVDHAGDFNMALTEALSINRGDRVALENVMVRECSVIDQAALMSCRAQVQAQAAVVSDNANRESDETIRDLRDLFTSLKTFDAPKTLILISEGFVTDGNSLLATDLGEMAAEARTNVYVLHLDNQAFDISDGRLPMSPTNDRRERMFGLEELAAAARGAIFTVAGSGAPIFDRIQSELLGYYLLGIESGPRDHDGKAHPMRIEVTRRGAIVRSRRQILDSRPLTPRSMRQSVAAALGSPLLVSALPLRVATFALQGPEQGRVQLLVHADVGSDYSASKLVSIGYVFIDQTGRVVEGQAVDGRLQPVMNGVPSSLQFIGGASLAPGDYTLKLVAAEGDRVGSVEHPVHAKMLDAGDVKLSELMVGGPTGAGELLKPTVGSMVSYGSVHGYLEAYGPKADAVRVKYEVAADAEGAALVASDVTGRAAGDGRMIFTQVLTARQLPPGRYLLRAIVAEADKPLKTLTRTFDVAPPAVLMTSAEGTGSSSTDAELFLPVDEQVFLRPFARDDALKSDTLALFRDRVEPSVKAAFEAGLASLAAGDYATAETSLKRAIEPDVDSSTALTYLAATFAASGHDEEAAGAWQTALADGAEQPQIYDWLSQSLLRTHSLPEARSVLEEAMGKWPADLRFTKPLAMLYATFGKGREAVRLLERYLERRADDLDALRVAVEWFYRVHASGGVVHSRPDDLTMARGYADKYTKAKGPQSALVRQWLSFLEREKR
jgi:VWFA-related protein